MLISLIIIFVAAGIGIASYYLLGKDNPVEEFCEDIIKEETGEKTDLTPKSPDKKDTGNKAAS